MSRLPYPRSIAGMAVLIALLTTRSADAQVGFDPGPPQEHRSFLYPVIIGVKYDQINLALAEHRLNYLQAKLRRDQERGRAGAVECDLRQLEYTKFRIAMDDWLIRWNSCQHTDFYPMWTDPETRAVVNQMACPSRPPLVTEALGNPVAPTVAPTISVTIINAGPTEGNVNFDINGVAYQSAGGSRQTLEVPSGATISFDSGGAVGPRQYLITPGSYEFESTDEGWGLHKLADTP